MCMGCAEQILITSEGRAPDTTEAVVYVGVFAIWVFILTHLGKEWRTREDYCEPLTAIDIGVGPAFGGQRSIQLSYGCLTESVVVLDDFTSGYNFFALIGPHGESLPLVSCRKISSRSGSSVLTSPI